MRKRLILILVLMPLMMYSQKGITFKVEELTKPDKLLRLDAYRHIYENLILSDANTSKNQIKNYNTIFPYNIVAQSKAPDSLVSFGYHPFFNGMYQAYADHRPFVLSPDMIWLLISQGFAQHVNNNSEELRKYFVDFNGKLTLIVRNDKIILENPRSPWEEVFPEFTKQIGTYTGVELINALTCDFSTTTPVSKVASEITIMEAMKSYFEFVVISFRCGIPEITLEGTPADWQKVLDKARYLRKYKLDWWIDEIEPLLEKCVSASKGDIDKEFWRNMFKHHSEEVPGGRSIIICGPSDKIDGWIVKFFPYDKTGKRNNLKEILAYDNGYGVIDFSLPSEIVKVDLKHIIIDGVGNEKTTPLEFWAGFVGLEQNSSTFSLKPQIGWMIRKRDIDKEDKDEKALIDKFKSENTSGWGGIQIRVKTVPIELLGLEIIKELHIQFIDEINIPEEMGKIKIDKFEMTGKISSLEIERVCKLFPNTKLIINNKSYDIKP